MKRREFIALIGAALQNNINTTAELGFLNSTFDVKKYSDLSIVEEAAKRLH